MADIDGGRWKTLAGLTALTLVAAGVLGYHPFAEDGGIYLAEIKRELDPALYPLWPEFVAGHLGWSVFTSGVAWAVHLFGGRLEWVMVGLHLLGIWTLLLGVWQLAVRCYLSSPARWGAVGTVALCLTMPIAGTSLLLMDPYVTARSVCLALSVLGTAEVLDFFADRRWRNLAWGLLLLAAAGAVHPLMAGYWVVFLLAFTFIMHEHRFVKAAGLAAMALTAISVAAVAQTFAAPETPDYVRVALTRYYWFLSEWQWFELVGLAAPLAILGWLGWGAAASRMERALARSAVYVGGLAVVIAFIFARHSAALHTVARMQPLRSFQVVYVVMLMALGAWMGQFVLQTSRWRWVLALAALAGVMCLVERETYPDSAHLELPAAHVRNQWEQAFLWIRGNTPRDALFALDSDYVHRPGEDTQGFRALTERSVLPDFSKDGGQAAIRPELTDAWVKGQRAQSKLTEEPDRDRLKALALLGVTWIVIGREGVTSLVCPYENERVKVCRLP